MKANARPYEILNLIQGTPEWLERRLKHATASNVPAIEGVCPYKTALQYFEELVTGESPKFDDNKMALFERGHKVEAAGRKYLQEQYGIELPPMVVVSSECPDLMASLDGFNEERGILFESKYMGREALADLKNGIMKPNHESQVQAQFKATGAIKCLFFGLDPDNEGALLEVTPNPARINEIARRVTDFMENVRDGKAPEASMRDFFTPVDPIFDELRALKEQSETSAKAFEELKKQVVDKYKVHPRVMAGGLTIIKSTVTGSVDYDAIPELEGVDREKYRKAPRVQYTVRKVGVK